VSDRIATFAVTPGERDKHRAVRHPIVGCAAAFCMVCEKISAFSTPNAHDLQRSTCTDSS
jgi:hypothetical protein